MRRRRGGACGATSTGNAPGWAELRSPARDRVERATRTPRIARLRVDRRVGRPRATSARVRGGLVERRVEPHGQRTTGGASRWRERRGRRDARGRPRWRGHRAAGRAGPRNATPARPARRSVARHLGRGAVITDVASTKGAIVGHAASLGLRFVGGHPMAGRETTGYEASSADLFRGPPVGDRVDARDGSCIDGRGGGPGPRDRSPTGADGRGHARRGRGGREPYPSDILSAALRGSRRGRGDRRATGLARGAGSRRERLARHDPARPR